MWHQPSWAGRQNESGWDMKASSKLWIGMGGLFFLLLSMSLINADPVELAITVTSPTNTTYNTADIELNWSANGTLDWAGYELDGATNNTDIFILNHTLNDSSTSINLSFQKDNNQTIYIDVERDETIQTFYFNVTGREGWNYDNWNFSLNQDVCSNPGSSFAMNGSDFWTYNDSSATSPWTYEICIFNSTGNYVDWFQTNFRWITDLQANITNYWILESFGDDIEYLNMSHDLLQSIDIDPPCDEPGGFYFNGTHYFVLEWYSPAGYLFRLNSSGDYNDWNIDMDDKLDAGLGRGLFQVGDYFYFVDHGTEDWVRQFDTAFDYLGTDDFYVTDEVSNPEMAIGNGTFMWVSGSGRVYRYARHYPTNPWIDVGNRSNVDWSYSGTYDINNRTSNLASEINKALNNGSCNCNGCSNVSIYCRIPITVNSNINGTLEISNIKIGYEKNTTITATDGTHTLYVWANETEGNMYYTKVEFTVDTQPPYWSGNQTNILTSYENTSSFFNITWQDDVTGVNASLIEGNWSGSPQNYTMEKTGNLYQYNESLPVGTHYWKSHANDSTNQVNVSDTWVFTILKPSSTVDLYFNGTKNSDKSYIESTSWNITACTNISFATVSIYIDSYLSGSGVGCAENLTVIGSVGSYNVTAYSEDTYNYSGSSKYHVITVVTTDTPTYSDIKEEYESPASYDYSRTSQIFNVTWTWNSTLANLTRAWLDFDGTNYTAISNRSIDIDNAEFSFNVTRGLGVETYGYVVYSNNTPGNVGVSSEQSYLIAQATPTSGMTLTPTPGWSVAYETLVTVTGSETNMGDGGCAYVLKMNDVLQSNPFGPSELAEASYTFKYETSSGCTNYSSGYITNILTVGPEEAQQRGGSSGSAPPEEEEMGMNFSFSIYPTLLEPDPLFTTVLPGSRVVWTVNIYNEETEPGKDFEPMINWSYTDPETALAHWCTLDPIVENESVEGPAMTFEEEERLKRIIGPSDYRPYTVTCDVPESAVIGKSYHSSMLVWPKDYDPAIAKAIRIRITPSSDLPILEGLYNFTGEAIVKPIGQGVNWLSVGFNYPVICLVPPLCSEYALLTLDAMEVPWDFLGNKVYAFTISHLVTISIVSLFLVWVFLFK